MENKKEKTALNSSALHTELLSSPGPLAKELQYVGADGGQPIPKITENSISDYEENIKSFEEIQREMQLSAVKFRSLISQDSFNERVI